MTAKFNEIGPERFKKNGEAIDLNLLKDSDHKKGGPTIKDRVGFVKDIASKEWTDWPGLALFDCRVWNVPNKDEAANTILWREKDATKNSISMAARHYYSHKELHGKSGPEMQELLFSKGVNWNDYPPFFKRGTFIQARNIEREFTDEELFALPEVARSRMIGSVIKRRDIVELEMPPFTKVTNRAGVVFFGEDPTTSE